MAINVNANQVYLAGGFYQDYKTALARELGDAFHVYDPETKSNVHQIPGEYVGRDLGAIRNSGLLIAYHDTYPHVLGMAAEVGYAVANNVPVIYVCINGRVDSFLSGLARATFTNMTAAIDFIKERYSGR